VDASRDDHSVEAAPAPGDHPEVRTDAVPCVRLDVRVRNLRGQLLIARREHALELSDSAGFVWRQLDGRRTVAEIGELLAAEYRIDQQTAIDDTRDVLAVLAGYELVTFRR
jgi:coenzyme PQQ synthesis protein D (PqqD)